MKRENTFVKWDGLYNKRWYDVRLPSGEIVEHCWPNAGYMNSSDGTGRDWQPKDNIEVRVSLTHPLGFGQDDEGGV